MANPDFTILSDDHMAAVVAAAPLRRRGYTVETFLSGNFKKQRKKATGEILIARDGKLFDDHGQEIPTTLLLAGESEATE